MVIFAHLQRFSFALVFVFISVLVACSGGGSAPPLQPTFSAPGPTVYTADATLRLDQVNVTTSLPAVAGYAESITVSHNDAPAGSQMQLTVSVGAPSGVPAAPSSLGVKTTMLFFTASSARAVTFDARPSFAVTVPPQVNLGAANVRLAVYNAVTGWTDAGLGVVRGNVIAFTAPSRSFHMAANTPYAFAVFATSEVAGCPTPPPTPTPSPTTTPFGQPANIYVATNDLFTGREMVAVLPGDANGPTLPVRSIIGGSDAIAPPDDIFGLALDSANNLYVAYNQCFCVKVYGPTADGSPPAALRDIHGSNANLVATFAVANNAADTTFVSVESAADDIAVFAAGADGNISPLRRMTTSDHFLASDMAFPGNGNLYAADDLHTRVVVLDPNGSGTVAPLATIEGSATQLDGVIALAFDTAGNLYVANHGGVVVSGSAPAITEYSAGSTGNIAPIRRIVGADTQLSHPVSIAIDNGGRIYIGQETSVLVFGATANGDAAPQRVISGASSWGHFVRVVRVR